MNRQETISRINDVLPQVNDLVLESVLNLLEQIQPLDKEMDAWDKEISKDSLSGKFDVLIQEVLEDHKAGNTTRLVDGLNSDLTSS